MNFYNVCMFPLIIKPTRITNHSATLVDNNFYDAFEIRHNSGIFVNDISDYLPILQNEKKT